MVRKVLAALLLAAAVTGTGPYDVLVSGRSASVADGTGVPKCC